VSLVPLSGAEQPRPAYFDQPAQIILPRGYNRTRRYPVFVLLPPTGVHSSVVARNFGLDPATQDTFILVFPAGSPTRREYLPDFISFVDGYETRLLTDLDRVMDEYPADPDRVYVGGYSLGGDLSWALSVRNPDLFAGAVIAGSRTSHPVSDGALETLADRGFRAAFLIGNREAPVRYRGINVARGRFDAEGVTFTYEEYSGSHEIPPSTMLRHAVAWVTGEEGIPAPAPRVAAVASPLVEHTSRDRFALWAELPGEVGTRGLVTPADTAIGWRAEWPWPEFYLRSTVAFTTTTTSTGAVAHRLYQDVFAATGDRLLLGGGVGGEWASDVGDGNAFNTVDLIAGLGVRNPWIIPAGAYDPLRVDALLLLRYTLPRGIAEGPATAQVFNLRADSLLRIADRFVLDASLASYTVQNAPVDTLADLSGALDHRVQWEAGLGVRAPSPLLWRVGYRGRRTRALPDGDPHTRGVWVASVEYSY